MRLHRRIPYQSLWFYKFTTNSYDHSEKLHSEQHFRLTFFLNLNFRTYIMSQDRFRSFSTTDVVYKVINRTSLKATILISKAVEQGKCSLMVHFRGGGLIIGHRIFPEWLSAW